MGFCINRKSHKMWIPCDESSFKMEKMQLSFNFHNTQKGIHYQIYKEENFLLWVEPKTSNNTFYNTHLVRPGNG